MDEKLIIALVAAGSAILGGVISAALGPLIKHWLEQSSARNDRHRAQIEKWRSMVLQIDKKSCGEINVGPALQAHPDFLTLEPYLSEEARRSVYEQKLVVMVGSTLAAQLRTMTPRSRASRKIGSYASA